MKGNHETHAATGNYSLDSGLWTGIRFKVCLPPTRLLHVEGTAVSYQFTVESVVEAEHWRPALKRAVDECERRNPGSATPDRVFSELVQRISLGKCVCLVAVDENTGKPRVDSVCGLVVMDFWQDTLGNEIAVLTIGWADARYRSKPMDKLSEVVDALAKEAGCESVWLYAKRNPKAYERWAGKRGYVKAMTVYKKVVRK